MSNPIVATYCGYQDSGMDDIPGLHLWNVVTPFYDPIQKQTREEGTTLAQQSIQRAIPDCVFPQDPKPGDVATRSNGTPPLTKKDPRLLMSFESVFVSHLRNETK